MSYVFHMAEHLAKRLSWLRAFQAGENTAQIARRTGWPQHMVHNEITQRSGSIDSAILETKRALGEQ